MKINDWSVVRSPNGVSLLHLDHNNEPTDPEICISIRDGVLSINLHLDGVDKPVQTMTLSLRNIHWRYL